MKQLKDVLREMNPVFEGDDMPVFSLKFMKINRSLKKGGDFVYLERAIKCGLTYSCNKNDMRGIKDLDTGKTTAVHNRLIFEFNNEKVFW